MDVKVHEQVAVVESLAKRNLELEQELRREEESEGQRVGEKYRRDYERQFLHQNH